MYEYFKYDLYFKKLVFKIYISYIKCTIPLYLRQERDS